MEQAVVAAIPAIILAMGGILKLVLNALDRVEARQEKFLGNHMSSNTKAMQDLHKSIESHNAQTSMELYKLRASLRQVRPGSLPEDGENGDTRA